MSSDWETCKENARPLKAGYKMKQLSSLLDTTVYQRDDLEQERRYGIVWEVDLFSFFSPFFFSSAPSFSLLSLLII